MMSTMAASRSHTESRFSTFATPRLWHIVVVAGLFDHIMLNATVI